MKLKFNLTKLGECIAKKFGAESNPPTNSNASDTTPPQLSDKELTNQTILDELVEHFSSKLEKESLGQTMLFPMTFNVLMHPADFDNRIEALPFIIKEIAKAMYQVIKANKDMRPYIQRPARYWYFQFSPCEIIDENFAKEYNLKIRRGHIITLSTLLRTDENGGAVFVKNNNKVSIKSEGGGVLDYVNVNMDAIGNLDIEGTGIFKVPYDDNLPTDINKINFQKVFANISLALTTGNVQFNMEENLVYVSGNTETRRGKQFIILPTANISKGHIQIKYDSSENKFKIAAYALTVLNERQLQLSSGGNVHWYDLSAESEILLNGNTRVIFRSKL